MPDDDQTMGPETPLPAAADGRTVLSQVIADFTERRSGTAPPAISTGIMALDRAIVGLRPGRMFVVAGRPGMGKSSLADSIRRSVVAQGHIALQFSLEMSSDEIGERELAYQAQINLRKVVSGREVNGDEVERVRIVGELGLPPQNLWRVYDSCFSMTQIADTARAEHARATRHGKRIGLVIVDYLQLIGDSGSEGRQQSLSAISRTCKLLSKELGCTVMALSQLNRGCEYRDDKRPLLADLRESGSIEQDADIVLFVYRDHVYNFQAPVDQAELIIRKHRSGPTGSVRVKFTPATATFSDPTLQDAAQERPYQ
jgi:replicative DNA helicase